VITVGEHSVWLLLYEDKTSASKAVVVQVEVLIWVNPGFCKLYTVFHKKTPFSFFFIIHSNDDQFYTTFLLVVAEEILIQNISTKCGS